MARELYNDVKAALSQNQNGLTESDILRKYLSLP